MKEQRQDVTSSSRSRITSDDQEGEEVSGRLLHSIEE
jgi:hypothetical protein